MKKLIVVLLCSIGVYAQNAQKNNFELPIEVSSAFRMAFPKVTNPVWKIKFRLDNDIDNREMRYESSFNVNDTNFLVSYDKDGNMKVVEKSIKSYEVLPAITDYLTKNYPNFKMIEASEVVDSNQNKTYQIGMLFDTKFEVGVFDKTGYFLYFQ